MQMCNWGDVPFVVRRIACFTSDGHKKGTIARMSNNNAAWVRTMLKTRPIKLCRFVTPMKNAFRSAAMLHSSLLLPCIGWALFSNRVPWFSSIEASQSRFSARAFICHCTTIWPMKQLDQFQLKERASAPVFYCVMKIGFNCFSGNRNSCGDKLSSRCFCVLKTELIEASLSLLSDESN